MADIKITETTGAQRTFQDVYMSESGWATQILREGRRTNCTLAWKLSH